MPENLQYQNGKSKKHVVNMASNVVSIIPEKSDLKRKGILSGKGGIAETAELAETVEIAKLGKK